ncbi:MAG TPA: hypothetical protein VII41_01485, partial [Steroidobacteraceae bacterium]
GIPGFDHPGTELYGDTLQSTDPALRWEVRGRRHAAFATDFDRGEQASMWASSRSGTVGAENRQAVGANRKAVIKYMPCHRLDLLRRVVAGLGLLAPVLARVSLDQLPASKLATKRE